MDLWFLNCSILLSLVLAEPMKVIALIVIAILFWSSDDARRIAAAGLNNTAEIINPDTTNKINISF